MCRLFLIVAMTVATSVEASQSCSFLPWTTYAGSPILRAPKASGYVFSSSKVKVDADGAPNAYHPGDVGLHCTKGTGFKGLDCPANAGYPKAAWWPTVLVADPANPDRPYVQPGSAKYAGFFVSQTSLRDQTRKATDPAKYVDSRTVPYLVFPRTFYKMKGTGILGDFGYALNSANGQGAAFVVAEIGPSEASLGEMSIALATALGGVNPNPRTGSGAPSGKILFVVFPYSASNPAWPLSSGQIDSRAAELLSGAGGLGAVKDCAGAL